MSDQNPYQPLRVSSEDDTRNWVKIACWWLVYLHPLITLLLIYVCWTLTTVSLGRPPRFGEHPENDVVHTLIHVVAAPAMVLVLGTPLLVPIAIYWGFARPFGAPPRSGAGPYGGLVCVAIYLLILALVLAIESLDPYGAIYWFMD